MSQRTNPSHGDVALSLAFVYFFAHIENCHGEIVVKSLKNEKNIIGFRYVINVWPVRIEN